MKKNPNQEKPLGLYEKAGHRVGKEPDQFMLKDHYHELHDVRSEPLDPIDIIFIVGVFICLYKMLF